MQCRIAQPKIEFRLIMIWRAKNNYSAHNRKIRSPRLLAAANRTHFNLWCRPPSYSPAEQYPNSRIKIYLILCHGLKLQIGLT